MTILRWRGSRLVASLAAAVLDGLAVVVLPAVPAYAAACSTSVPGVTMVVDFASLGGGVVVACAAGDPASGYAALHEAGFTTVGTQQDGPAFVCRINGKPTVEQEKCDRTPRATAYWSYWHAQPGGSWSYSQLGPMSYNPAPGTVEGWAFGSGAPPSITPPRLVTPAATRPSTPVTTSSRPGTTTTTGTPVRTATSSSTEFASETPASTAAPVSPPPTTPAPPAPASASAGESGGPGAVLVGVAIVAVLGASAATIAWRRRSRLESTATE